MRRSWRQWRATSNAPAPPRLLRAAAGMTVLDYAEAGGQVVPSARSPTSMPAGITKRVRTGLAGRGIVLWKRWQRDPDYRLHQLRDFDSCGAVVT